MDIAVLVKGVPDFREGKVQFKEDNTLNRGATPTVLNPNDHLALKAARELKVKHGANVSVLSMGPPNYKEILKEAMAWVGDDLYLLSDAKLAGADTWATSYALSSAIEKIGGIDVVIAGFKTADGETGQTGPQTALLLDRPIVTHVRSLQVHREEGTFTCERILYNEVEVCEGPLPAFIVTDPEFDEAYPRASQRLALRDVHTEQEAKLEDYEEHLTVWDVDALGVPEGKVGLKGSPTIVRSVDPIPKPPAEREPEFYQDDVEAIEAVAQLIVERGELA